MNSFSQLAQNLVGSEIVRLGNIISQRLRDGETIYNYTIGDFDPAFFPIPSGLKAAIQEAYAANRTNYPPAEGIDPLREAVAGHILDWLDLSYSSDEILIASGGRPLIYSLFKMLVDPGDKVIYAVPSWNNNHYVEMNRGQHCVIETTPEASFMPTAAQLQPHIQEAILLCLCSPQNPTGTTFSREALEEICDLVLEENARRGSEQRKLYVMYDQMYALLTYGSIQHHNPVSLRPAMKEYTVFIDGISKLFAATGVRVGWSLGPAPLIAKMKALLTHIGAWAPMAEQVAVANFLPNTTAVTAYLDQFRYGLELRLRTIYDGIMSLKSDGFPVDAIEPQAGLYLTVKFDLAQKEIAGQPQDQEAVTAYLLQEASLAVVPFYAFGASADSAWYRLSVGTCDLETIPVMFKKLRTALEKLGQKQLA